MHEILQEKILDSAAIPFSRGLLTQGLNLPLMSPALAGRFFTTSATWEALYIVTVPCLFPGTDLTILPSDSQTQYPDPKRQPFSLALVTSAPCFQEKIK